LDEPWNEIIRGVDERATEYGPTCDGNAPKRSHALESVAVTCMVRKVNLAQKLSLFHEYYTPKIVAEVNDVELKVVKVKGEFEWHTHDKADELFLVLKGRFCVCLRSGDLWLDEGELAVVPRGVEHRPFAEEEAHILLVELKGTVNTADLRTQHTVLQPEKI
jgi:quercetin dioxygenase-like cupin family protein